MSNHRKHLRNQMRRATSWPQSTRPANPQANILAGLNVMRVLEDHTPKYLQDVLYYGPGSYAGAGWAAALIWYRQKGYHTYKTLTLFGVWAVASDEVTNLLLGTKTLKYSAPLYNPEAYHQLIKRDFQTYYDNDGSPPASDAVLYETRYDLTRRLVVRQTLADEIIKGLRTHKQF